MKNEEVKIGVASARDGFFILHFSFFISLP
jgi:hypothetical protein